jgi:hypothetical protein
MFVAITVTVMTDDYVDKDDNIDTNSDDDYDIDSGDVDSDDGGSWSWL